VRIKLTRAASPAASVTVELFPIDILAILHGLRLAREADKNSTIWPRYIQLLSQFEEAIK
jgi:hypothetical protein